MSCIQQVNRFLNIWTYKVKLETGSLSKFNHSVANKPTGSQNMQCALFNRSFQIVDNNSLPYTSPYLTQSSIPNSVFLKREKVAERYAVRYFRAILAQLPSDASETRRVSLLHKSIRSFHGANPLAPERCR